MVKVSIDSDLASAERFLTDVQRRHLPFAGALALTRSAERAKKELQAERAKVFDRPNPWTRKAGAFVQAATKTNLQAAVMFSEGGAAGRSAFRYLRHQIEGGARPHKGFEKLLIGKGLMLASEYAVPARGVQLDRYGNISPGVMTKIISQLKAFRENGFEANATGSRRSRAKRKPAGFFVADGQGELRRGIWLRRAGRISPVLIFVRKAPSYQPIYRHEQVAGAVIDRAYGEEFGKALDFALRTAR